MSVHLDIRDPFVMFTVLFMTLPAAPAAIAALVLRQKVRSGLNDDVIVHNPGSLMFYARYCIKRCATVLPVP